MNRFLAICNLLLALLWAGSLWAQITNYAITGWRFLGVLALVAAIAVALLSAWHLKPGA